MNIYRSYRRLKLREKRLLMRALTNLWLKYDSADLMRLGTKEMYRRNSRMAEISRLYAVIKYEM